jgi:hypothetical protein
MAKNMHTEAAAIAPRKDAPLISNTSMVLFHDGKPEASAELEAEFPVCWWPLTCCDGLAVVATDSGRGCAVVTDVTNEARCDLRTVVPGDEAFRDSSFVLSGTGGRDVASDDKLSSSSLCEVDGSTS